MLVYLSWCGASARSRRSDARRRLAQSGCGSRPRSCSRSSMSRSRSSSSMPSTRAGPRAWPPSGFSVPVGRGGASRNTGLQQAFLTSVGVALGRHRWSRMVLGALASLAVARYSFFGRETISFVLILAIALPGHGHGHGPIDDLRRRSHVPLGFMTIVIGHATFCIVLVYNNAVARYRRHVELARGGIGRPRRRHVPDVPLRHVPGAPIGADRRWPAGVRPVVRRGDRHDIHGRRRQDPADLDLPELPARQPGPAGQRRRTRSDPAVGRSRSTSPPG